MNEHKLKIEMNVIGNETYALKSHQLFVNVCHWNWPPLQP